MNETEHPPEHFDLSFGEELRRERDIRGISLKEIADATKISKRFLESIEKNDYKNLPAPVFTRGFIREYARYLGLNADDMVNRYMHFARSTGDAAPIQDVPLFEPQAKKKSNIPRANIDRNVVLIIFLVIALVAVGWWVKTTMIDVSEPRPTPVVSAPLPIGSPQPAITPTETAEDVAQLRLTMRATSATWLEVEADGNRVYNGEMQAGDEQTFTAQEAFLLKTVGNAAGLELSMNGRRLPPLGGTGQVVKNRTLDRETLESLPAAADGRGRS